MPKPATTGGESWAAAWETTRQQVANKADLMRLLERTVISKLSQVSTLSVTSLVRFFATCHGVITTHVVCWGAMFQRETLCYDSQQEHQTESRPLHQPISQAFAHCPRCGQRHSRVGANPFCCSTCDFVFFFSPTCAVAGIVTNVDGQLLLLRRARDPGKGKFGLPGGFVDAGESAETALMREIDEEVNLSATSMRYLCSLPNMYVYKGVELPVTDIFFVCEVSSFDRLKRQESEVASVHFCHATSDELDQMAFPSNRRALEIFLQRQG